MKGRTRENGNATMQTGFVFGYDRVQFLQIMLTDLILMLLVI